MTKTNHYSIYCYKSKHFYPHTIQSYLSYTILFKCLTITYRQSSHYVRHGNWAASPLVYTVEKT